jgi:hypothetical protein
LQKIQISKIVKSCNVICNTINKTPWRVSHHFPGRA